MTKKKREAVLAELKSLYPKPECALNYTNPLELLIATILSAQCTDERVNKVTENLFQKYTSVVDFAEANEEELQQDIHSTGFYKNKAKHIQGAARKIITDFNGEVPNKMEELLTLPGVARKTANVVLGEVFKISVGIVVDTHVTRLSNKFGWTKEKNAVKIEKDLMKIIPKEDWIIISHLLILHGRQVCNARKPKCEICTLKELCPSSQY